MSETPKQAARKLKKVPRRIQDDQTVQDVQRNTRNFLGRAFQDITMAGMDDGANYINTKPYQFDVAKYTKEVHKITLWSGQNGADGQLEIAQHYEKALLQQHEKQKWEQEGQCDPSIWKPGETIQTWIRVEAGHTVGKTLLASMLVNHFFDCFRSVTYCFAPTYDQINNLLFKEIRKARENRNDLPGQIMKTPNLKMPGDSAHWVQGRATGGGATERVQGQHEPYMLFILDEAEGVADYVWDAVQSMTGGGIYIVLCLANPRTDSSMFARLRDYSYVKNFRLSCIDHPNVVAGKELVKGAVRRDYVTTMMEKHCDIVREHEPDYNTFEVPWNPGAIYMPNAEFLFRVLGIAPADRSNNTFCPPGRVEAAMKRMRDELDAGWLEDTHVEFASIGVDCARYGSDSGKIYTFHKGEANMFWSIYQQNTMDYYGKVHEAIKELYLAGARVISVRVDGGGGYGSGVIDLLNEQQTWDFLIKDDDEDFVADENELEEEVPGLLLV